MKRAASLGSPLKRSKSASLIDRSRGERLYWLCKCEPADLSIDTLESTGSTQWDGVRNPTARNHLISMRKGDLAFFYISSVKQPAVVAVMQVDSERAVADETQFDQSSCYFDSSATRAQPKWFSVRFRFLQRFDTPVVREVIKGDAALADMQMLRQGRLSVSVVTPEQWDRICALGGGFSDNTDNADDGADDDGDNKGKSQ
jgi:predicted RNA-binding protein with PUA-like domain